MKTRKGNKVNEVEEMKYIQKYGRNSAVYINSDTKT